MAKTKTKKSLKFNQAKSFFNPTLFAFVFVFAAIGGYLLYHSFALSTTPGSCTQTISSGLSGAISGASSGAVICLNSGSYGDLSLSNVSKSSDVTIQPGSGASVTLGWLSLNVDSHLRFSGNGGSMSIAGMDIDPSGGNSTYITVDHAAFHGAMTLYTRGGNQNIVVDSNTFYNINENVYEGRISVRGYDNSSSVGVTISNNKFGQGGCSDGVQIVGGAYGVNIQSNEFSGIDQGSCTSHNDPIQFYGADHTIVTGNYFHDNGDGSGGIESFDGNGEHTTVTNNVFNCTCSYPWSIAALGGQGWTIQHNTIAGGGSLWMSTDHNGDEPSGMVVRDNVFAGGGGITADSGYGTNDHNLNAGISGTGNISGTPSFVGGANPTTYAGYALTSSSVGHNAASDGTDMGANVSGGGGGGGSGDTTAPTVSMTAPSNGATISGSSVTLSANASDNVAVAGVQFQLDGNNIGSADTSAPYSFSLNSTVLSNGSHSLSAIASDSSGNTASSSTINVTVSNSGTSCTQSSSSWQNTALASQTGTFTVSYDDTPLVNNMDGVTGFSAGAATDYPDLAAIVRFNSDGTMDARNGDNYASDNTVNYSSGITYHVRLSINLTAHTYTVYVTPQGGSQVTLASNYAFRTEQAGISNIANWAIKVESGTHSVCNMSVSAGGLSCVESSTSWQNNTITSRSGNFTVNYDDTPEANNMNGVTGLSNGAATDYTSLAVIIRFNSSGDIDAINGGGYSSANTIPYTAGTSYHVKLLVNATAHTYTAYITLQGGSQVTLASNYAFRTEQASTASFNNWALKVEDGSHSVCNFTASASSVPGDANSDGHVNINDLSLFLTNYGGSTASCDFNSDGIVNILDFSIILQHYGS